MAKRFTDTDKWNRPWFRKLGTQGRDLWNYLHENCDHAGLFDIDCEKLSFVLGFKVEHEFVLEVLRGKFVQVNEDRIFLPAFIEFQYGRLSETSKPHAAVIKKLKAERVRKGLAKGLVTLWEEYSKGIHTLKDKDQDKDQDKEKEKDQDQEKASPLSFLFHHRPEIQEWLNKGNHDTHLVIVKKGVSHHELVDLIEQAFDWAQKKNQRAETWLLTFVANKNTSGYGANKAHDSKTPVTPGNDTANPFIAELERRKQERGA